jgi:hypothetical protein
MREGASNPTDEVPSVLGELHYLDPASTVLRRFTAPGASANTGRYEPHVVPIRDGRSLQDSFRMETQGFEVVPHTSAVTDFTDKVEVDAVYVDEVIAFIKDQTGADEVVSRGWVLRRSAAPAENASQPQAALVHIDYGPEGAAKDRGPGLRRAVPRRSRLPQGAGHQRMAGVQPAAAGLAVGPVRLPQRARERGAPEPAVLRRPHPG